MAAGQPVNPNLEIQREKRRALFEEVIWRAMLVLAAAILSAIAVFLVAIIYAADFAVWGAEVSFAVSGVVFSLTFLYFMYRFHEGNWGEH